VESGIRQVTISLDHHLVQCNQRVHYRHETQIAKKKSPHLVMVHIAAAVKVLSITNDSLNSFPNSAQAYYINHSQSQFRLLHLRSYYLPTDSCQSFSWSRTREPEKLLTGNSQPIEVYYHSKARATLQEGVTQEQYG
jgi:hypothetical protein